MIIDLVRHGDTGRRGHFDGRHDPPLLADACAGWTVANTSPRWRQVICSPLLRARQTAQALAADAALPVSISEDWAEWHFGDWEGKSQAELADSDVDRVALAKFQRDPVRFPPPNAEPWEQFQARVERGLRSVMHAGDQAPLLIVSHAGPIRMAISLACGFPLSALWALRIEYGTRVRLRLGVDTTDRLWGELIELRQACD